MALIISKPMIPQSCIMVGQALLGGDRNLR